jgi:hypothetical protein
MQAVSCYAPLSCAAIDDATGSGPRFETTVDGGTTWTTPAALTQTGDSVRSLACSSSLDCVVVLGSTNDAIGIYVTIDGGTTWTPRAPSKSASWESLTSLTCRKLVCVGLAQGSSTWHVVRTTTFAKSWSLKSSFSVAANSTPVLACSDLTRCALGGTKDGSTPWLATYNEGALTSQRLTYIPSPILQLSCGPKVCSGIAITTLLTLRP